MQAPTSSSISTKDAEMAQLDTPPPGKSKMMKKLGTRQHCLGVFSFYHIVLIPWRQMSEVRKHNKELKCIKEIDKFDFLFTQMCLEEQIVQPCLEPVAAMVTSFTLFDSLVLS